MCLADYLTGRILPFDLDLLTDRKIIQAPKHDKKTVTAEWHGFSPQTCHLDTSLAAIQHQR